MTKCFACNKKLGKNPKFADTRDDQHVYVGSECFKEIAKSGNKGWMHKSGGLRLWVIDDVSVRITGQGSTV